MSTRSSVAVLSAAVLSVAGCGGDDAPSEEEYIAEADAICLKADKRQAAVEKGIKGGIYGSAFSDEKFLSRYNAVTQDALKQLSALEAPEGEQKAVDDVLAAVESSVAAVDKRISALRSGDRPKQSEAQQDFERAYGNVAAAAGAIGLSRCQGMSN